MTCSFCTNQAYYRSTSGVLVVFFCLKHMEEAVDQVGPEAIVSLPKESSG